VPSNLFALLLWFSRILVELMMLRTKPRADRLWVAAVLHDHGAVTLADTVAGIPFDVAEEAPTPEPMPAGEMDRLREPT
jgi:hypothetical protein